MPHPLNPALAATFPPPVMEARRWLDGVEFTADRPLINVSQAAPVDPPPEALRQAIAEAALNDPQAHLYGPVLGLPDLRAELAHQWGLAYGGEIAARQVAITQGCNQAFCATLATLAGPGDEVILPTPWYFNHKMWLDMAGVQTVPLAPGAGLLPDPEEAAAKITDKTRAIVLVSPNNPGGAEYPAELLRAFADLAKRHKLALIVDETYRDFDSRSGAPHDLFSDPDWTDYFIHLYSFSKAYRLTGHRVGAIVAGEARLAEVEKFLDTVAICPSQLGQMAALWGMLHLSQWVAGERAEILRRRAAMEAAFADLEGWEMLGCGAYFAYVTHPDPRPSPDFAQALVREAGVLMLPGTMFMPQGANGAAQQMRIAFANVDADGIATLRDRLAGLARS
ncbi:aspartate/methionine/tyrosine aminotransferase [Thioclava sp. ES.031]|uniref:aminotransferase n=1 Tax=Thioclava sp. ES.031 TaxID=1798203 RepID=UPI000BF63404|nr:aminotransferase [Thioclava sp. ES.031]PFG64067.1 aspartate/methionine/tyrosine aminotransferase [Thioclava sp. ES.031]